MKPILNLAVLAVLLVAPGPCFALWVIDPVTRERSKELGMEVRSTPAGPNDVRVELEFKAEGPLKDVSHVDLRVGDGEWVVVAALKEDRSKPGRVVVSFAARARLDAIRLWVMVPGGRGGVAYELLAADFVERKNDR